MKTATEFVSDYLANLDSDVDKSLINKLLLAYLNQNVVYSEDLTKQSEEQALASISLTFGMVQKDELIISEGELITDEKYNILNSLRKEYDTMSTDTSFFNRNFSLYGQIVIVSLAFLFLFMAIRLLRPEIMKESRSINMILVMMLLVILPSFIIIKHVPNMIYLMPVTILSMLLVTFFDARIAIFIQTLALFIISLAVPNSYQYFVIQWHLFLLCQTRARVRNSSIHLR